MKIKFSRAERLSGLFVVTAVAGLAVTALGVIVKRGFFEPRQRYHASVPSAVGLRAGTPVQISGIKIGAVDRIALGLDGRVDVGFFVLKSYIALVREGSHVGVVRPTIVGDRVIDLAPGAAGAASLAEGSEIPLDGGGDITDLIGSSGGRNIAKLVTSLDALASEALSVVRQAGHENNVQHIAENLRVTSDSLRRMLPTFVDKGPGMTKDLAVIVANLSKLTTELSRLAPILSESAQAMPAGTKKTIELLNETVTLVRGMQRSFLFRGGVQDVKDEEKRVPASE